MEFFIQLSILFYYFLLGLLITISFIAMVVDEDHEKREFAMLAFLFLSYTALVLYHLN